MWILGIVCVSIILLIWGSVFWSHTLEVYGRARDNHLTKSEAIFTVLSDFGTLAFKIVISLGIGYIIYLGLSAFFG